MRLAFVIGSMVSLGSLLVVAACGGDDAASTPTEEDAGTDSGRRPGSSSSSSSSGSSGDPDTDSGTSSSSSSGGTKPKGTNLTADPGILWGVTDDGYAIYQPLPATQGAATSLDAYSIADGTKTQILATVGADDVISVSGGAVAWWSGLNADNIGTINLWTKANGVKSAVATGSLAELWAASPDGSRVAFSVGATATSTNLAVTGTATPSSTAVLSGAAALNLAATDCSPDFAFVGNVFFSGHCTGTTAGATAARLYTVAANGNTATRLDGNAATGALKPQANGAIWFADDTGSKVFVTATTGSTGRIITVANGQPGVSLEANTQEGFMLPDGSAAVYRTTTTLGRHTGAAATQLLANGTTPAILYGLTNDGARLFFTTNASGSTRDTKSVDTTTANQTAADIAPSTASFAGFTGNSARALYLTDLASTGANLKSKPVAGGAEVALATGVAARPLRARTGTGVGLLVNPKMSGQLTMYDLQTVDGAGGSPIPVATTVPQGLYEVSGAKLVYVTFDKSNPGLYVVDF